MVSYGPRWFSRYSDSLRAGRSGDRIPVGASFSAPVQTGPETHSASYTMGTVSLPGVKRPGRDVDHSPPSSAKLNERVKLYLYSPSGSFWSVLGWTLPLPSYAIMDCNRGNRGVNFVNTKLVRLLGLRFRCTIQEELEAPYWRSEDAGHKAVEHCRRARYLGVCAPYYLRRLSPTHFQWKLIQITW